jgi:iron-sulfur cluster assembly protein
MLIVSSGMNLSSKANAVSITDRAAAQIAQLLAKREKPSMGIKVGIRTRGCSGLSYTIEYADEIGKFDEVVEDKGVRVLIDPKAVMFLIGTEMDFVEEKFKSGFTFNNPNEKGRCGCGESFSV